ncbi:MAG: SDR family NAD(P)-dependent oxidoreductase, partial [Planctomycetes bacterium]|nr:SDR family NAD(P)-dependent oxidoreductase [Planctomycetota bacterium]
ASPDWSGFDEPYPRRRELLPTYPFQRECYPIANKQREAGGSAHRAGDDEISHPLLGCRIHSSIIKDVLFESRLCHDSPEFLDDHRLHGTVVFPLTAYVEMALAAGREALGAGSLVLEDVVLREAMRLPEDGTRTVQFVLSLADQNACSFEILSLNEEHSGGMAGWTLHAAGRLRPSAQQAGTDTQIDLKVLQSRCTRLIDRDQYFQQLREKGLAYGPTFQGLERLWLGDREALARITIPDPLLADGNRYSFHPALLDACLQVVGALRPDPQAPAEVYLPFSVDEFHYYGGARSPLWCHAVSRAASCRDTETRIADLHIMSDDGQVVAALTGFKLRPAGRTASPQPSSVDDLLFEPKWQHEDKVLAFSNAAPLRQTGQWLILADESGVGAALAKRLKERGESTVLILPAEQGGGLENGREWVNPRQPDGFQRLLERVREDGLPCRGVVHLWSLNGASPDATTAETLKKDQVLTCQSVLHLVQALARAAWSDTPGLWLVTRGAQAVSLQETSVSVSQSPLWGLGRVVSLEHPEFRCERLDLDPEPDVDEVTPLFDEMWHRDSEDQIAWRDGRRFVARVVRVDLKSESTGGRSQPPGSGPFRLEVTDRGVIDHLALAPATRHAPGPGEVEIQVYAAGLNFRDVLNVLDAYSGETVPLGIECAGTITARGEGVRELAVGDEVLGFAAGSFGTFVTTRADLVTSKPQELSLEQAASIPAAFVTACYALMHVAKMSAGERVLIHAAAGGVGLAAVQLARRAGAEVFATAGSCEKRRFLRGLGIRWVMNSRTTDFAAQVKSKTGGEGVDIVLNCLTGESIPTSLSVLRRGGRFLELGRRGTWSQARVREFRADVSYSTIAIDRLLTEQSGFVGGMLCDLVADVGKGLLQPLPVRSSPILQAAGAFRRMSRAGHIGKIVLLVEPSRTEAPVHEDGTYLITGGLGGLGLEVARWLVERGARHIVLLGRSAASQEALTAVHEMEARGAKVAMLRADVSNTEDLGAVMANLRAASPPLRGVVHAAGVLDDGVLLNQSWARFEKVMAPKVAGAWHLHTLTKDLDLDFFVLFSSAASLLGSLGQGNHAAANAFLDGLAHLRRCQGLPASSINWGPWAKVGAAASHVGKPLGIRGLKSITPQQGIEAFEHLLRGTHTQVGVLSADVSTLTSWNAAAPVAQLVERPAKRGQNLQRTSLVRRLRQSPRGERRPLMVRHLRQRAARLLGLSSFQSVDPDRPLSELGLDSLMALEFRNVLRRDIGSSLPSTLLFDQPTIRALSTFLMDLVEIEETPAVPSVNDQDVRQPIDRQAAEPIAIIGQSCRVPGAGNPEAYWQLLRGGVDAITEIPSWRWDVEAYYDVDPEAPGKMYTRWGGFLNDVDKFDAHFFGISPREAVGIDPQQRLLLEVSWEALERSGQSPNKLAASRTGVFVGISNVDYAQHLQDAGHLDVHSSTGVTVSVAAGRLSYFLGLRGPAMVVDTACSSSLVAVHLACQSLRNGECSIALAGGVNLILSPNLTVMMCELRAMSPDGRCKAFDASANGYVGSEGCGIVVLKRLSDALANGDPILAVIRGSAVNHDGRSSGLTAPSGPAQADVIRLAIRSCSVLPDQISYVEAHGTGTALGDPIEVHALGEVFGVGRDQSRPLVIGS